MSSSKRVHFRSSVNGKNRSVIINKSDAKDLYDNVSTAYSNAAVHAFREEQRSDVVVEVDVQSIYDTLHSFVLKSNSYAISNPRDGQYFYIRKV